MSWRLDQGTTSSRCILFNRKGEMVSVAQKEFTQIYPKPGWVEHDAMEIWSTQIGVAQEAMRRINASYQNIEAVGITNQRETTVIWDRKYWECRSATPIVWQCRRTAEYCDSLKEKGLSDTIPEKDRASHRRILFLQPKIRWILENIKRARERAEAGELLFGTIETWLIWKLTMGKNALSRIIPMLPAPCFSISIRWNGTGRSWMNSEIPRCMLPEPKPSSGIFGMTDSPPYFGGEIPIAGAAGDQQAAHCSGRPAIMEGEAKNTYGTGCFPAHEHGNKAGVFP